MRPAVVRTSQSWRILGTCAAPATLDPDLRVTSRTPPTFIVQAWDDSVDQVCNSLVYAKAPDRAKVSTELPPFATGEHNFGLRRPTAPVGAWPALVEREFMGLGVLPPPAVTQVKPGRGLRAAP